MHLIALYTDFGNKDIYAGILKAQILSLNPGLRIVDMSHSISKHDIVQGAMFIKTSSPHFLIDTIHIALVHSFYQPLSEFIFFQKENQYFIGPNNGFFSLAFPRIDHNEMYSFPQKVKTYPELIKGIVDLTNCILNGDTKSFPKTADYNKKLNLRPVINTDQIRASIVYIDEYGNAITNLGFDTFERVRKGRMFNLYFERNHPLQKIMNNYADVSVGEPVCFFNASSLLEIAVNLGNVSELFNLNVNETIQIDFYG